MSNFPLFDIFRTQTSQIQLDRLVASLRSRAASGQLGLNDLYVSSLEIVKAPSGVEHQSLCATIRPTPGCQHLAADDGDWIIAFDRSQNGSSPHRPDPSGHTFEYPPGPRGSALHSSDNLVQSLKMTGYLAADMVTLVGPSSPLATRDPIARVEFPAPPTLPSDPASRLPELEPNASSSSETSTRLDRPNDDGVPLYLTSLINLAQLLHEIGNRYNLFSTNCFWNSITLFQTCAVVLGIQATIKVNDQTIWERLQQGFISYQDSGAWSIRSELGSDTRTPGSFKNVPVTDPPSEKTIKELLRRWQIANGEFMNETITMCVALQSRRLVEREARVAEREAAVNKREVMVNKREAMVNKRGAMIDEREAMVEEREAMVEEREAMVDEMLNSRRS